MAIISQTISPLSAIVLISEVDRTSPASVQAFQQAWEGFNLQLKNTTVGQLNTFATQTNEVRDEVNTFANTAATQAGLATQQVGFAAAQVVLAGGQATLATTKANEASASAASALASKNAIEAMVIPSEATYNYAHIDNASNVRDLENFLQFNF
jgi:hypothetical protein